MSDNAHPLGEKHRLDDPGDNTGYAGIHAEIHPIIRSYLESFGYYDIFLVDPDTGDIIYSVYKELDFATSLLDGPYANSNLGEVFRKARELKPGGIAFTDFEQYRPSYDAPASFIAAPIFDGSDRIGVLIFQMPLDRITQVMSVRGGLGESGESYLVGPDHLMRSDAYHDENRSVTNSFRNPDMGALESLQIVKAIAGEYGVVSRMTIEASRCCLPMVRFRSVKMWFGQWRSRLIPMRHFLE